MTSQEKAQQERVARNFFDDGGRLRTIPSKHAKLLVVLERLAQEFEPGQTYPESEVNQVLQRFHPDHAALRRYLVENAHPGLQSHPRGRLAWRSGGTFEV